MYTCLRGVLVFYHPDFTVGTGITPVHAHLSSRALTASRRNSRRPEVRDYYRWSETKRNLFCNAFEKFGLFFFVLESDYQAFAVIFYGVTLLFSAYKVGFFSGYGLGFPNR